MNSPPLSESMPRMGNGSDGLISLMASTQNLSLRPMNAVVTVQPVAISVMSSVFMYSPRMLSPQWATRSTCRNPGLSSCPICECADWNLVFEQCSGLCGSAALDSDLLSCRNEDSVDGGSADGKNECFVIFGELDLFVSLEACDKFRQEWLEPFAAQKVGCGPDALKGLVEVGVARGACAHEFLFRTCGSGWKRYRVLT